MRTHLASALHVISAHVRPPLIGCCLIDGAFASGGHFASLDGPWRNYAVTLPLLPFILTLLVNVNVSS